MPFLYFQSYALFIFALPRFDQLTALYKPGHRLLLLAHLERCLSVTTDKEPRGGGATADLVSGIRLLVCDILVHFVCSVHRYGLGRI